MEALNLNSTEEGISERTKKRGLSGSTLKFIAITAMLIDHIGAALLGRYVMASGYMEIALSGDVGGMLLWLQENGALYGVYTAFRMIGRIAFPIFVFLLIEGFQKTRNKWKYAMRLGVFALISEIPFDLAFSAKVLEFSYQNVYFTLFLGLIVLMAFDGIGKSNWVKNKVAGGFLKIVASGAVLVSFCALAAFMNTDYGAIGVFIIAVLYLCRKKKPLQIAAGCIVFLWELTAPFAFIPIGFYNGERGLRLKYLFYWFYPVHLLLIYIVCMILGVAGYSVM